jgi:CheY-like chemotaxis protein
MLIDDMLVNLHSLQGFLDKIYDLKSVTSCEDAILALKRNFKPDLLMIDMDMPKLNGIQAAEKIKNTVGNNTPVLYVIEKNDRGLIAKCRKAGAAGYIVRPYKPTYVKAEIKRILTGMDITE